VKVWLTFDDSQTGERVKQAVNARSAFSATSDPAAFGENQDIILYGNVLNVDFVTVGMTPGKTNLYSRIPFRVGYRSCASSSESPPVFR
jgi:hypothetical protein